MDGSSASLIVIPIVVTISLAAWLIAVFYADSHPRWRGTGSLPAPRWASATAPVPEPVPAQKLPIPARHPAHAGTTFTSLNQADGSCPARK